MPKRQFREAHLVGFGLALLELKCGSLCLIDERDFDWLSAYNWCKMTGGYAIRRPRKHEQCHDAYFWMHREIARRRLSSDIEFVDHINGDTLDNRVHNLRVCEHRLNAKNQKLRRTNTSGFKGVYYDSARRKWAASVKCDYRKVFLGRFSTAGEASAAYEAAASELFGEFKREPEAK